MTNIVENNKCNKKLTKYEQCFKNNNNNNSSSYYWILKETETNKIATNLEITKREQPQRQQQHDLNKTHKQTNTYKKCLN